MEYLAFNDARAYFRGKDTSVVKLYNVLSDTFPSGLLPLVRKAAEREGFELQLFDNRTKPCEPLLDPTVLEWLRDYQFEAVKRVIDRERGILWCPTGSGKTEMAIGFVSSLPCRWIFLVHRSTLMVQTAERFEKRLGFPIPTVGDGHWPADAHQQPLVVATFQTLARALTEPKRRQLADTLLRSREGVIVDESHVTPAESFWRVAMHCPNAYYRIGMSGTPLERGDRRSLLSIAALGPVIYRVKTDTLVKSGTLAKPIVKLLEVSHNSQLATWQGVYRKCVVQNKKRNTLVASIAKIAEKPCFLFVKEIAHGKKLEAELSLMGISCAFVWGTHSTGWRDSAIKALVDGRIEVLITSVVLQEGIDVPALRSVIVASGGKSVIATLQRLGRGIRRTDKKTTFELWDIADRGCGCKQDSNGGKHKACEWLEKHTLQRMRAYASEGHQTTVERVLTLV
jgi:superfamily II DNA or RNA helicase